MEQFTYFYVPTYLDLHTDEIFVDILLQGASDVLLSLILGIEGTEIYNPQQFIMQHDISLN